MNLHLYDLVGSNNNDCKHNIIDISSNLKRLAYILEQIWGRKEKEFKMTHLWVINFSLDSSDLSSLT
jgi:hypothetical protein